MFRQIATKLVGVMVQDKIVLKDEEEIYLYGLETLIASIINVLLTISIGAILGYVVESIVFLAFYCPLRQFAGGYHAPSYLKCTLSFLGIFALTILGYRQFGQYIGSIQMVVILLASCIGVVVLAPIEDPNKVLDLLERRKYKEKAIRLVCLDVMVIAILLTGNDFIMRLCVFGTLAIAWISMLLLLGFIKNFNYEGKKRRNYK
jgi:accessory gene regulator B